MAQYSFKNALNMYPRYAEDTVGELKHLHSCKVLAPQDDVLLTPQQKKIALKSIMTAKEHQDESLKVQLCPDIQKQREMMEKKSLPPPS